MKTTSLLVLKFYAGDTLVLHLVVAEVGQFPDLPIPEDFSCSKGVICLRAGEKFDLAQWQREFVDMQFPDGGYEIRNADGTGSAYRNMLEVKVPQDFLQYFSGS